MQVAYFFIGIAVTNAQIPSITPTTSRKPSYPPLTCTSCIPPSARCYVSEPYFTCLNWDKDACLAGERSGYAKWCGDFSPSTIPPSPPPTPPSPSPTPSYPPLTCTPCSSPTARCYVGEPYFTCLNWDKDACLAGEQSGYAKWCGESAPSPTIKPCTTPKPKTT